MEDLETPWEEKLAAAKANSGATNDQVPLEEQVTQDDSQAISQTSVSNIETTQDDSGQELFNQSAAQVNQSASMAAQQESDS